MSLIHGEETHHEMTASRRAVLEEFKNLNKVSISDISLLDKALTHRSFSNENQVSSQRFNNERLEFLGDAVLGQCVATYLYARFQERAEGELAQIKSVVVSEKVLAPIAVELGIPAAIQLGKGEENSGGRNKRAILADCLEAIIAAVFMDRGGDAAFDFVTRLLEPQIMEVVKGKSKDYKTILQEYAQKYLHGMPEYRLTKAEGPEHDRVFSVECVLGSRVFGPCQGKSRKEAEQNAAYMVYRGLESESAVSASRLKEISTLD